MCETICLQLRWTRDGLYGLNFKMQSNQREDQTLQILDQVVETAQALRILRLIHVNQRAGFRGRERDVLITDYNLQLLEKRPNKNKCIT